MAGFIPQAPPQQPVTKTVIGPNGQVQQVQVNPVTGEQVNLAGTGYDAITNGYGNGGGYWSPSIYEEEKGHDPETAAEQVLKPDEMQRERASDPRDKMTKSQMSGPTNNFGYIDKPGWLGYTSNIPGMPGMIGKGVNAAINANNAVAMNKARDLMDIDALGPGRAISQIAKDKKGQVANVNIGDESYNVGFEALSPDGQTNLTPNEARQRAGFMNTQVTENTPAFARQEAQTFKRENPDLAKQNQGLISGLFSGISDGVRGFVDSLFGGEGDNNSSIDRDSFPDAPSHTGERQSGKSDQSNKSDPWGGGYRDKGSTVGGGVSSGGGGLY